MAAAALLDAGTTALVAGGPGIVEALEARGITATREGDADAVLVGFHRDFDFERLTVASGAVRRGARLIGTNDDATYPTPEGEIPGGGGKLINAVVPLAEMFGYSTTLRSLTQGRATYTMEFKHYAAVPKHILDQIATARDAK